MAAHARKRVVGWSGICEWERVYHDLYSEKKDDRQHGLDKIAVWKCRMLHKLSKAVECTSQLVAAQLAEDHKTPNQDLQCRMLHAMALIRFMNVLTESQQNRRYTQPIHVLADQVGLPNWLSDLRHDASHSNLPSLAMLHSANKCALQWLKKGYWDIQKNDEEQINDNNTADGVNGKASSTYENLAHHLSEYLQDRFQDFNNETRLKSVLSTDVRKRLEKIKTIIQRCKVETLMQVLLEPGYLLPTTEQIAALTIKERDLVNDDGLLVHKRLLLFWQPVLDLFNQCNTTASVLQGLLTITGEVTDENSKKRMAAWASTILHALSLTRNKKKAKENPSYNIFKTTGELPTKSLLNQCLKCPNEYTATLLGRLLPFCNHIDTRKKEQLVNLVKIISDQDTSRVNTETSEDNIYTATDLLRNSDSGSIITKEEEETSDLSKTTSKQFIDWSLVPFGAIPGQCDVPLHTKLELSAFMSQDSMEYHHYPLEDRSLEDNYSQSEKESEDEVEVMEVDGSDTANTLWNEKEIKYLCEKTKLF